MFNFDCGVTIYDESYLKYSFTKDIDKLGLAHLAAYGYSVTIVSLLFFKEISPLLSSTKNYPMFFGVIALEVFNIHMLFLRATVWRKAAIAMKTARESFELTVQLRQLQKV